MINNGNVFMVYLGRGYGDGVYFSSVCMFRLMFSLLVSS